jgi:hypothetical protein
VANFQTSEVDENLHQPTWDHEILYTDRYLNYEWLLIRPFLWETKNTNVEGSWILKFVWWCMETTHETFHLDKWSLAQSKIMDILTSFIWIIILFDRDFKYGDGAKFLGYVWTNADAVYNCQTAWGKKADLFFSQLLVFVHFGNTSALNVSFELFSLFYWCCSGVWRHADS